MLKLGVFGGYYFRSYINEYPSEWFEEVNVSPIFMDKDINYFKVNASKPLEYWQKKAGFMNKIQEDGFNGIVDII